MTVYIMLTLFVLLAAYNTFCIMEIHKKIETQRKVDKLTQEILAEHNKRISDIEKEV